VPRARQDEAVAVIKAMYTAAKVGDPLQEGDHLGPVVNKAQHEKIRALIQSAIDEGARLECGGVDLPAEVNRATTYRPRCFPMSPRDAHRPGRSSARSPRSFPTIPSMKPSPSPTTRLWPFGLYHRRSGAGRQNRARAACRDGCGQWLGPHAGAPFGGYKQSGNGREGGLYGLRDFMEVKAISGIPA
jgi:aldehyde dehydrogenase (NAD+)